MNCNSCGGIIFERLYESRDGFSLTSLCAVQDFSTKVYVCGACSHVQSFVMEDIDGYYENRYDILTGSEEEDQIYEIVAGRRIYRTEHQVRLLLEKVSIHSGMNILDYGCAKSATMRALARYVPNLQIHLFDVSDRYRDFWRNFVPDERVATFTLPREWQYRFDIVTSFFSLEHMSHPRDVLLRISELLVPNGVVYGIVPNGLSNVADMIVADHVNHFTPPSLESLLRASGFKVIEINQTAHRGALVFIAQKVVEGTSTVLAFTDAMINDVLHETRRIGRFWQNAGSKIRTFEQSLENNFPIALFGAGFYGAFIATHLRQRSRIRYVVDQNVFLHGKEMYGAPVIPPVNLPDEIKTILIGLNPVYAREIVAAIPAFQERSLNYFYL